MRKISVFVLLTFLCFIFCTKNSATEPENTPVNHAPVIVSMTAVPQVFNINMVGKVDSAVIAVEAFDEDGDSLTYEFRKAVGKLGAQNCNNIYYTPPTEVGDYVITCSVSDGKADDFDSTSVSVTHNIYPSKIAFHRFMGLNMGWEIFEIYVMDSDGSNQIRLTDNNGYNMNPSWSPDGTKIAFASNKDENVGPPTDIYVMNADGSNQIRLTNNSAFNDNPSWSPDGSKIAFSSGNIYVMNTDGSNQIRLTFNGGYDPSWSPDGSKIAFSRRYDMNIMNADGTNITKLTDHYDDDPSWSPDGSKIAFVSNRNGFFYEPYEIFVMNADGSNQKTLIKFGEEGLWSYGIFESPSWSPDGSMIVFSIKYISPGIYVVNADVSNIIRLTNKSDNSPSWSPFIK